MEQRVFLLLLFVACGTFNVLIVKWADMQLAKCNDGIYRHFQHPVVLTLVMFLGESLCYIIYKVAYIYMKRRGTGTENEHIFPRGDLEFSPLSMLLPALLDSIGSILLFTGLYLTYATSLQLLRGAALIFVGLFSAIYLNSPLLHRHWMAMFTICCGVISIISTDVTRVFFDRRSILSVDSNAVLTGDLLILCSQVLHALQLVYEEKHQRSYGAPPLQMVGWQGIFGIIITSLFGICFHFLPSPLPLRENGRGVFDDLSDLIPQLSSNIWLIFSLLAFMFSCGIYNLIAINIVKFSSSTNRILADGLRVFFISMLVVLFEWERVNLLTIMACVILQLGIIAYRNAMFIEWYRATLARWQRARYVDFNDDANIPQPRNQPADVI